MKFRVSHLVRPLFESALIVFSVLLALYANRWAENQRTEEQKQVALARIVQELRSNRELISEVLRVHERAIVNLQKASTDENDSLRVYLTKQNAFNQEAFGFITNGQAFYPRFPSSTSWNAAKSTAIIAEFEYEIVEALTDVYDAQEVFLKETFSHINQILYKPLSDDELDTIGVLLIQIGELASQEEFILFNINKALKAIEGERLSIEE